MATTIIVASNKIVIPSITTSTNLGPLPTTSFPANCLASLWDLDTFGLGLPWTYETQGCAVSTCCPYGNYYTEPWAWLSSYYSPGVCPSEYRSCRLPDGQVALTTSGGESIALCCPTNYGCPTTSTDFLLCQSLLSTSTDVVVLDNIFDQSTVSTRPFRLSSGFYNSYQIAYPIQVRSRAGEASQSTRAQTIGPTPAATSSIVAQTTSPSPSSSHSSSQSTSKSISSGAFAGIVIGAIAGIAVIGLLIWIALILRKRNKSTQNAQSSTHDTDYADKQSSQAPWMSASSPMRENQSLKNELPVETRPYWKAELSGDERPGLANMKHPSELEDSSPMFAH